jgi:hypothetical protein
MQFLAELSGFAEGVNGGIFKKLADLQLASFRLAMPESKTVLSQK